MQNPKVQAIYYKLKRNSKINHEVTQYKLQLGLGPHPSLCRSWGAAELWGAQLCIPELPQHCLCGSGAQPWFWELSCRSMPWAAITQCLFSTAGLSPPLPCSSTLLGFPTQLSPPRGLPSAVPMHLCWGSPGLSLPGIFPQHTQVTALLDLSHIEHKSLPSTRVFCSSIHGSGDSNPL